MDNEQNQLSLENLMIAAPCDVDWEDMVGDDRVRRCSDCKLNVYNVQSLTRKEVTELLNSDRAQSGRLCLQLYRRADGTLLTADCPRGLEKIRAFSSRLWRTVAAALTLVVGGSSVMAQDKDKATTQPVPPNMQRTTGVVCPPKVLKNTSATDPTKSAGNNQTQIQPQKETKVEATASEGSHSGKAHFTAYNFFKEGQQLEKSGDFAKAAKVYQQALRTMSKQKHDPKFHLKIETALSRVKAKAGINQ
jgi:hypothetical protein